MIDIEKRIDQLLVQLNTAQTESAQLKQKEAEFKRTLKQEEELGIKYKRKYQKLKTTVDSQQQQIKQVLMTSSISSWRIN
jgi:hypothetical protein